MAYEDIPDELQQYAQWINWIYKEVTDANGNVKYTKVPVRPIDGKLASVTNPLDWTTFDRAKAVALRDRIGLGFVFTKSDPFCGFDLDDAAGNEAVMARQREIYATLNSYSEWSPSGKGLHVIVKAKLPGAGRHPKYYGVFDNERYFAFTGNILYDTKIRDCQNDAERIYETFGSAIVVSDGMASETEIYSDVEVLQRSAGAANGDKFNRLFAGDWQTDYGSQSQSEADIALVNILGFYSRNIAQTCRLFRASALGQRAKALARQAYDLDIKHPSYVGRMARKAMDRLPVSLTIPTESSGQGWFDPRKVEPWQSKVAPAPVEVTPWQAAPAIAYAEPAALRVTWSEDDPGRPLDELSSPIPPMRIPGLVGELTAYCWHSASSQIAEVAIASALSMMSIITARSYARGTLGLSLYLMVLARTSTGKSFMYSANDRLMQAVQRHFSELPPSMRHTAEARLKHVNGMIMTQPGSAQGLAQHIQQAPATLIHADEYVEQIRMMANPNPPPHLAQMRAELLTLVEHSGPGKVYRARKYSTRGPSSIEGIDVPCASVSMLASGTPESFYDELTATLLTSGFLPRITILDYEGGLTQRNLCPQYDIDPGLMSRLMTLLDISFNKSLTITGAKDEFSNVGIDLDAADKLQWFLNMSTRFAQQANERGTNMAGMWSRSYDNVQKIASLIAIGVNPHFPMIERLHVDIAIQIVQPAINKIQLKITGGEVGVGDDRLEAEIKRVVHKMIHGGWDKFRSYPGMKKELIDSGYFQLYVIRNHCMKLVPFKNNRLGASTAFDKALAGLVTYGTLTPVTVNDHRCVKPNMTHFQDRLWV